MSAAGPLAPLATLATLALALAECAPPVSRGGFDAPDPASKIFAIERAMRGGDSSAVPALVEQLDSDDPLVRMMAIEALRELTDTTCGYRFDDPPLARREAIRRWVAWLEGNACDGEVTATASEQMYERR